MSSPKAEHSLSFLPRTVNDANSLDSALRLVVARLVVDLHGNAHLGELMGDKPPRILLGCRKIRFDAHGWHGKPRYRLVYRNEPADGAPHQVVVLAIGRRDRMIAYAKAAGRLRERIADEGLSS